MFCGEALNVWRRSVKIRASTCDRRALKLSQWTIPFVKVDWKVIHRRGRNKLHDHNLVVFINSVQREASPIIFFMAGTIQKPETKERRSLARTEKNYTCSTGLVSMKNCARNTGNISGALTERSSLVRWTAVVSKDQRYLTLLNFRAPYWRRYMLLRQDVAVDLFQLSWTGNWQTEKRSFFVMKAKDRNYVLRPTMIGVLLDSGLKNHSFHPLPVTSRYNFTVIAKVFKFRLGKIHHWVSFQWKAICLFEISLKSIKIHFLRPFSRLF